MPDYDQQSMTSQDYNKLQQLGQDWQRAYTAGDTAGMETAHQSAEQLRAAYGYSGGTAGDQYIPLSYTEQAQANAPTYAAQAVPATQDYSQYLKDLYASNLESALAGYEGAYQNSVAELDAAAGKIPAQYQSAKNDAAGAYQQTLRNAAEYANAQGLNSGAAAQARLSTGNQYAQNLTSLSGQEADAMADLELQRTQLANSYQTQIAQAKADNNAQLAQQLYEEYIRQDDAALERAQVQSSLDYNTWQAAYQAYQDAVSRQEAATEELATQGWNLISQGVLPNANQLEAMGMDSETAEAYIATLRTDTLSDAGWNLLAAGVMPSAEQLEAMGIDSTQATNYIAKLLYGSYSSGGSSGSSSSGSSKTSGTGDLWPAADNTTNTPSTGGGTSSNINYTVGPVANTSTAEKLYSSQELASGGGSAMDAWLANRTTNQTTPADKKLTLMEKKLSS